MVNKTLKSQTCQMAANPKEIKLIQLLGWLAGADDLFRVFQGATGISVEDLQVRHADPDVLLAVHEFLSQDDTWVIRAASGIDIPPEEFAALRTAIPGGEAVHWT